MIDCDDPATRSAVRADRGRFVESARYAAVPAAAQALTGRVDIIPVLPLTQGEIDGVRETFVARLLDGDGIKGLLKDRLGPRLQEAVILYSGQYAYRYEGWAWILPLSQIWT